MKIRGLFTGVVFSIILVAQNISWSLSEGVKLLVNFETKANAVSTRSNQVVDIENYEIPYVLVEKDLADRIDAKVIDSFVFEKNGDKFVRWVINPEDTKWHKEVETFLKKHNVSIAKHTYFKGYQTASRSYIVEDPNSKVQFSLKASTDKTGGNWKDKKQEWKDATDIRRSADYVMEMQKRKAFENFIVLDEPGAFGLAEINQGIVIRMLGEIPVEANGKIYIPGFSAVHESIGRQIAEKNGILDPEKFWHDNYNIPLAKALAELLARTGMNYDSPHSQNFLVELDRNYKPTGKIILRDLGDMYLNQEFFKAANRTDITKTWDPSNIIDRDTVSVGILHGNEPPKWLSMAQYSKWGTTYNQAFTEEYARITGISETTLKGQIHQSGMYFSRYIEVKSEEYKTFYSLVNKQFRQLPRFLCKSVLVY